MFKILKLLKDSLNELKNPRTIVICGVLLAVSPILGKFNIPIAFGAAITFNFILNVIGGFLFGPIPAGILAMLIDFIGYILNPRGAYHFGFGFNAFIGGAIYGLFFYKKHFGVEKLIPRIIVSRLIISVFVNLILGTLLMSAVRGKGVAFLLPGRLTKEVIEAPIRCVITFVLLTIVNKHYYQINPVTYDNEHLDKEDLEKKIE